ncbi:hypothetical protein IU487_32380 [Nocardia puris]|uniref:hypothetical protein n=1 Tax=Nocardia puris TaxID=208602 RepID=UPI001893144F|nr:hypothetical protein [Nocardia puris]MBF6215697.1 hypothetical protein [Nocardia puris]
MTTPTTATTAAKAINPVYPALYVTAGGAAVLATWVAALDLRAAVLLTSIGVVFGISGLAYVGERLHRTPRPLLWLLAPIAGQAWGLLFAVNLLTHPHGHLATDLATASALVYIVGAVALVLACLLTNQRDRR